MKSFKDKLKIFNEWGKGSGLLLLFHRFKGVGNEPFFYLVIWYTFENKRITELWNKYNLTKIIGEILMALMLSKIFKA